MKTLTSPLKTSFGRANAVQLVSKLTANRVKGTAQEIAQCKLQQLIDKSPRQTSLIQNAGIQSRIKQLKKSGDGRSLLVAQRTIDTAAEAFFRLGTVKIKERDLKKPFCTEHKIEKSQLPEVQTKLDKLRADSKAGLQVAQSVDMTNQANWPVGQIGMVETDAKVIAEQQNWDCLNSNFSCSDSTHTPKGKLYFDKASNTYYGADNTGHVGWGFKVWQKRDKTTLDYKGNIVWDGARWNHNARGTK
jgi:hypothetical protein